jgi:1-acyl-sn-glycerol-3-phosphate acyltransferase
MTRSGTEVSTAFLHSRVMPPVASPGHLFNAARHAGRGLFNALAELGAVRLAPPRDSRAAAHRLAGVLGTLARAHDLAVTVHGEVPRSTALIVANHVGVIDALALIPVCPAIPLARGALASWPLIGPIGHALGVCFVGDSPDDRVRALRRVHALLAAGTSVVNFALAGASNDGMQVGPLWRGTFGIAARLGVPVVPIAIRPRGGVALPSYVSAARERRIEVMLHVGAPIHARTGEAPEVMAARTRGTIAHLLERLRWLDGAPVIGARYGGGGNAPVAASRSS